MNESISRLMDGEVGPQEFEQICAEMKAPDAMGTWVCYHVIGDHLTDDRRVLAQWVRPHAIEQRVGINFSSSKRLRLKCQRSVQTGAVVSRSLRKAGIIGNGSRIPDLSAV